SACLGLARSLVELGQYAQATAAIERARAVSATAWEPAYWEGRSLLSKGDPAAALEAFDGALRKCRERKTDPPADLVAYRAVALGRSGKGEGALEALLAHLEKTPGMLELYPEVIALCAGDAAKKEWAAKRRDEMAANQERIDQLEARLQRQSLEQSAGTYIELARAYSIFRLPVAYDCLFLASELDPSNAGALKDLLKIRKNQQEVFFRLRLLRRLLAVEPGSEAALYGIAEIFVKLHVRTEEARELVTEGLRRHPDSKRLGALRQELASQPGGG
ncbi:MAG: tetratricopeptide repeat protein, partial [Planctomycetota bacterium]|nr:tetratricopeptide repeat protein [Planctomycetota bacterium]